jgi:(p)ppGpp synthase/HD superfamily hydrolase
MPTVLSTAALLLSSRCSQSADAFTALHNGFRSSKTSLAFRSNVMDGLRTDALLSTSSSSPTSTPGPLPTWLSYPQAHLKDSLVAELSQAMKVSFFTETETLQLLAAVEEAAGGDAHKVAGTADFLRILVETMEMGLNALVAAAFHYADCVELREHTRLQSSTSQTAAAMVRHANLDAYYGEHVSQIADDAGRLKQLEWVAQVVMQTHASRASPDAHDAENLRQLLLSETRDWRALAIRAGACLYRLRGLLKSDSYELTPERVRVGREALSIYAPLASRLGMHRLKNELEGAAFRVLYQRQYQAVNAMAKEVQTKDENNNMRDVLAEVKNDLTLLLQKDPEFSKAVSDFTVTARVKESYSMWKKMLRHGYKHLLQVPDALALRIVLNAKKETPNEPVEVTRARERALCYYAQKLCTSQFAPVANAPRFKDYVERPKPNGYQSLHYTATYESWKVEIQVRSGEMHQVAEFGLASHWDYKASQDSLAEADVEPSDLDQSSDAYVRKVQEWHWDQHNGVAPATVEWDASPASFAPVTASDIWQSRIRAERIRARTQRLEPYLQALTAAQSDLAREYVFCFLKSGDTPKVLALPAGACVLDALRQGGVDGSVQLNGVEASITRQLTNGDVLTISSLAVV